MTDSAADEKSAAPKNVELKSSKKGVKSKFRTGAPPGDAP